MAFSSTQSPFGKSAQHNSMGTLNWIAWALVVIAAFNWGSVGLLDLNLISLIFADMPVFSRVVYGVLGIAGLYFLTVPFQARYP